MELENMMNFKNKKLVVMGIVVAAVVFQSGVSAAQAYSVSNATQLAVAKTTMEPVRTKPKMKIKKVSVYYRIIFATGGLRCLDLTGGNSGYKNFVRVRKCNHSKSQKWTFTTQSEIKNANGLCLDLDVAGIGHASTNVKLHRCINSARQRWQKRGYTIRNSMGKCLDLRRHRVNGQAVKVFKCDKTQGQVWKWKKL